MKPSIAARLASLESRLKEIDARLSDPGVVEDRDGFRKLSQERAEIHPVVEAFIAYRKAGEDLAAAEEMAKDASMREFAEEEIGAARERLAQLEGELERMLLPRDPNDEKNLFLEIRAGTGGDESALFAGDLFRMYSRFAERNRWQVEVVSESPGEAGGYKEIIARVVGQGAYSKLKFESGGHRVQRVPATETQGRIHTSAATVAVLPEVEDVDVDIDQNDLQIDVYRSGGPGGQSVNTTDSAVRITHKPSGVAVAMQDEKSQLQNREKAMRVLRARLYERALAEQQAEQAAARSAQVGTGERAEKIRTYNFPERRVTDHRIKFTAHNLDQLLQGDLDEFTAALQDDEKRRGLEEAAT
jgi:peptide chain release factor 1